MPNTVQPVFLTGRGSSDHTSSCAKPAHAEPDAADSQHHRDTAMRSRSLAPEMVISCEVPAGKSLTCCHGRVHSSRCDRGYGQPHFRRAACRCAVAAHQESAVHESERSRTSPTRLPGPPALILRPAGTAAKNRDAEVPGPAEPSSPPGSRVKAKAARRRPCSAATQQASGGSRSWSRSCHWPARPSSRILRGQRRSSDRSREPRSVLKKDSSKRSVARPVTYGGWFPGRRAGRRVRRRDGVRMSRRVPR